MQDDSMRDALLAKLKTKDYSDYLIDTGNKNPGTYGKTSLATCRGSRSIKDRTHTTKGVDRPDVDFDIDDSYNQNRKTIYLS